MPSPVVAGRSFVPGLRAELLGTYRRMFESQRERLARAMALDLPSTRRTELYFFWLSAPHMVKWSYGETMSEGGFKGRRINITNVRWGRAISWQADDRADDQTNSLLDQARGLGQSAALLDERVLFQIMQGTSDADLLTDAGADPGNEDTAGGVPNAPDGQALFSTTRDGSADRFGASNGNLLTGTALTAGPAESDMRTDYWSVREQYGLFQDTEGQPLFNSRDLESQVLFIFAMNNWEIASQAFQRSVIPDQAGGAGVSAELIAAGLAPLMWPSPRITTDDYFSALVGAPIRAIFSQSREPINEVIATMENSDIARQTDEESIRFKLRKGFGVAEPYAMIQTNNVA